MLHRPRANLCQRSESTLTVDAAIATTQSPSVKALSGDEYGLSPNPYRNLLYSIDDEASIH